MGQSQCSIYCSMLKIFFARDVIMLTRAFFDLYGLIDLLIIYLLSLFVYYNYLFIVYSLLYVLIGAVCVGTQQVSIQGVAGHATIGCCACWTIDFVCIVRNKDGGCIMGKNFFRKRDFVLSGQNNPEILFRFRNTNFLSPPTKSVKKFLYRISVWSDDLLNRARASEYKKSRGNYSSTISSSIFLVTHMNHLLSTKAV